MWRIASKKSPMARDMEDTAEIVPGVIGVNSLWPKSGVLYVMELDQAMGTYCLESRKAQCSTRSFFSSISMKCLLLSITIPNVAPSPTIASCTELLTA